MGCFEVISLIMIVVLCTLDTIFLLSYRYRFVGTEDHPDESGSDSEGEEVYRALLREKIEREKGKKCKFPPKRLRYI